MNTQNNPVGLTYLKLNGSVHQQPPSPNAGTYTIFPACHVTKFLCVNTVSDKFVRHSLAYIYPCKNVIFLKHSIRLARMQSIAQ